MKLSRLLVLAAAATPLLALAQSPAPSPAPADTPSLQQGGSTKDAAATVPLPDQTGGPNLEKPIQLIPDNVPSVPRPKHGGGKSHSSASASQGPGNTFRAEVDLKSRIRMRQLYTRVLNEPETQSEWAAAHSVKTDPERRALLKTYYTHLYARMLKLDPSLAERIKARKANSLIRLQYPRLDAEAEPAETDSGLAAPGIPTN